MNPLRPIFRGSNEGVIFELRLASHPEALHRLAAVLHRAGVTIDELRFVRDADGASAVVVTRNRGNQSVERVIALLQRDALIIDVRQLVSAVE